MMIIELKELNVKKEILINSEVIKDDKLDSRIHELKDSTVSGRVYINNTDETIVDLLFRGIMVIDDSVTLEKVDYPFEIQINDNIVNLSEEFADCVDFTQNILDILQLLWENIVLEVPIRFTTSNDANIRGEGWELNKKDNMDTCDPRLEKLKELLKGDD